jgi:predicted phosphohydrolase
LDEGSPQKTFLRLALDAATLNRAMVPWIVVTLHKPLYCSAMGTPSQYAGLLEDILIEYDVDLTITGHMHCYEVFFFCSC